MRSKILHEGHWYKPVPWHSKDDGSSNECDGCALDVQGETCHFNTDSRGRPCNDGNEFTGKIFIRTGKEAMAAYVLKRLGAADEEDT